ncbi:MAG: glutathione peroxidase [Fimbriiglobus sp.]
MASIYDIPLTTISGQATTLEPYRGKVLLIVNVAGKCGFTGQYTGLEALYQKYKERGLLVLGFPCNQFGGQEPGDEASIQQFCSTTYQVTFPMFAKVEVNGSKTHPLYAHLKAKRRGFLWSQAIKWNFTKFLVSRTGEVTQRVSAMTSPASLEKPIEKLLG